MPEEMNQSESAAEPSVVADPAADTGAGSTPRLVKMLVIVGGITALSIVTGHWPIVMIVGLLIVIVMIHEFGHFLTARWSGMKVTEFFVGFGPRIWSFRRGEVEYGIKAIPAGGYVKIIGMSNLEEVAPADEARTYRQQSFFRRFSVAIAGSFMHFVMAFLLMAAVIGFYGLPDVSLTVGELSTVRSLSADPVTGALPKSTGESLAPPPRTPAQKAGFKLGDEILMINGKAPKDWEAARTVFTQSAGEVLYVDVRRNGNEVKRLVVVPAQKSMYGLGSTKADQELGFVGLGPREIRRKVEWSTVPGRSASELWSGTTATVGGIGKLFSPTGIKKFVGNLTGDTVDNNYRPVSVVGIAQIGSEATRTGVPEVLGLLAVLNISLGVFNMLPMLPLDGGHVAVAIYERIRSRRNRRYFADVAKLMPLAYGVVSIFLLITISAVYLEIVHPITGLYE